MSEIFFEHEKNIALYLLKNKGKGIKIYDDNPRNIYADYIFHNQDYDINKAQRDFRKGYPYFFDNIFLDICPKMENIKFKKGTIVADSCLDEKTIQKFSSDPKIKKIPYEDFSLRNAYFIF
jgi:hypothetical protein